MASEKTAITERASTASVSAWYRMIIWIKPRYRPLLRSQNSDEVGVSTGTVHGQKVLRCCC